MLTCTRAEPSYLSQVPVAVLLRYPLSHRGSSADPDRPMVGVNPSCAWRRGRQAETQRQDAQPATSASAVADHLLSLLFPVDAAAAPSPSASSSSSSADSQTTKLLCSPSHTFIGMQLVWAKTTKGTFKRNKMMMLLVLVRVRGGTEREKLQAWTFPSHMGE